MCLICMKYKIIMLIIIIINLGQIFVSYIANTSRTDAMILEDLDSADAIALLSHQHTKNLRMSNRDNHQAEWRRSRGCGRIHVPGIKNDNQRRHIIRNKVKDMKDQPSTSVWVRILDLR